MKKISSLIFGVMLLSSALSVSATTATPTESSITIDGQNIAFNAYNIDGFNYFKLRDIAYALKQTEKKFDIGYDSNTNTIFLTSGKPYTVVGGEMQEGANEMSEAVSTNQTVVKDGESVNIEAYNIDGSNYSKLRDLGEQFDFDVDYDADTNNIEIKTTMQKQSKKSIITYSDDLVPAIPPSPTPHK